MDFTCPSCGETFETREAFVEHDIFHQDDRGTVAFPELEAELARATSGDTDALHAAVTRFNWELEQKGAENEQSPDVETDNEYTTVGIFDEYFERLADCLDEQGQNGGWELLSEFADRWGPYDGGAPRASLVVENAVARHVIRTRLTDGVDAIPVGALEYLRSFGEEKQASTVDSKVYGWGIGHERHPVADHLHSMARDWDFWTWVAATLEQAFYADQDAAVELLERIVRDEDIAFVWPPHPEEGIHADRLFLDTVGQLGRKREGEPFLPRSWDWREEFDYSFEWHPENRQRVRELVEESGVDESLPDPWTLEDLAI